MSRERPRTKQELRARARERLERERELAARPVRGPRSRQVPPPLPGPAPDLAVARPRRAELADRFIAFLSFRLSPRAKLAIRDLEQVYTERDPQRRPWRVRRWLRRMVIDLLRQEGLLSERQAIAPREQVPVEGFVQRVLFDLEHDVEGGFDCAAEPHVAKHNAAKRSDFTQES